jgi:DNA-binding SARP family transcriptional activator
MEFRVLGPLEVIGPHGAIAIASGRQRAILGLLVLDLGRTVASERLIDEVWGADPPASVRQALRVHVAGLRRLLGSERIDTQPQGYRLRAADATVDLEQFDRLVADASRDLEAGEPVNAASGFATALALWRGSALADLAGEHAARAARARLDELRAVVFEHWVDAELASGRHLDQLPELRRMVTDAPLREAFQARLMVALYRSGRQADALAVYRAARDVLDRELGVEPGPELEAAQRAVLTHDPDLAMPRTGQSPRPRTSTGPSGDGAAPAHDRAVAVVGSQPPREP